MMEVKNLTFRVDETEILSGVNVSFAAGRITAIIGPNGCGKSTLMSFLGKQRMAQGHVFLNNHDVAEITAPDFARQVAMLPQRREVMANFKVIDVVVMGRYPYKEQFHDYTAKDYEIAKQALEEVGGMRLINRNIGTLSGGEVQRVLIAKTLAQATPIILLDEPTNHLDVKYKVALMNTVKACGRTVIMVLHDLSLAVQYADEAVVMKKGRVFAQGPAGETLTPKLLEEVFSVPFVRFEHEGKIYINY